MTYTKSNETKKVIVVIVEGPSDRMTFENSLRNYWNDEFENQLKFIVFHGDCILKKNQQDAVFIEQAEVKKNVNRVVRKGLKDNKLKASDLLCIVHLCDLDYCFSNKESALIPDSENVFYDINKMEIHVKDSEDFQKSRESKRKNINILKFAGFSKIESKDIPYNLYYFNLNLEHSFYDEPNSSDKEKENNSFEFDEKFTKKKKGFIDFLEKLP